MTSCSCFAGIDWASRAHAVCVVDGHGHVVLRLEIAHSQEGIERTRIAYRTAMAETGQTGQGLFEHTEEPVGVRLAHLLQLAQLRGGRVAEQPFAGDPVPVGGCPELAQHA